MAKENENIPQTIMNHMTSYAPVAPRDPEISPLASRVKAHQNAPNPMNAEPGKISPRRIMMTPATNCAVPPNAMAIGKTAAFVTPQLAPLDAIAAPASIVVMPKPLRPTTLAGAQNGSLTPSGVLEVDTTRRRLMG